MPAPPARLAPSPNRHSTTSGTAETVTCSPASVTDRVVGSGAGSSQNQEAAPVNPRVLGERRISPGTSGKRSAIEAAIAPGASGGPPGVPGAGAPTTVKHGSTLLGAYMHAWPLPSVYQNEPGPTGAGFLSSGESLRSDGYGFGSDSPVPGLETRLRVEVDSNEPPRLSAPPERPGRVARTSIRAAIPAWLGPYCCDSGVTRIWSRQRGGFVLSSSAGAALRPATAAQMRSPRVTAPDRPAIRRTASFRPLASARPGRGRRPRSPDRAVCRRGRGS